ncbi:MAG TPA: 16S rRNA (cytidine(1402)-2'-O)-methyltransferase [Dehalococcoidia bacterium]|nr:16S rRNA (cytidine(1402)-2'-O)-methyltransferase [Dehalococcoidia bacterium]
MPTLYLVATPIGNLDDITLRALQTLRQVALIACEDTRTTRHLLAHFDIRQPTLAYNEHNHTARLPRILATLEGGDVAFVSEAGMPAISDPGEMLVRAAIDAGHRVIALPGPSAVVTAIAVSGLPPRPFTFLGFLPRSAKERRKLLASMAPRPDTLVAFEAPHRLREALEDAMAMLGERRIAVCRELTKLHEEVFRGTLREALAYFQEPRGEFTLVIEGAPRGSGRIDEHQVLEELRALRDQGVSAKQAIAQLALTQGLSRRELYRLWLQLA